MQVPFVDLKTQYQTIREEILAKVEEVFESTSFVLGPFVSEFEQTFSKLHDVKHTVALNSGTSADQLAIQALIQPGDEVITTPNTFIATAEAITAAGGKIVFVDIEEKSYNMNPNLIESVISPKTKAIVPVHLYGQPADMEPILEIAKKYRINVIEDAAQAVISEYKGKKVGSIGDAAAFSFYPGKNLGAYGEGGAVTTNCDQIAEFCRLYRDHGSRVKYIHEIEGYNMRMEAIQGAILNLKLKYIDQWTEKRRKNATLFNELLLDVDEIVTPTEMSYAKHVFHLYVIRVKNREQLQAFLHEKDIASGFHYKYPLHLQKAYHHLGYTEGDFPVTEKVMQEIISLPMYPELAFGQIEYVVDSIKQYMNR